MSAKDATNIDITKLTLTAKSHEGKIAVNTEITVPTEDEDYIVMIIVTPQKFTSLVTLDQLYGVLANDPIPELSDNWN